MEVNIAFGGLKLKSKSMGGLGFVLGLPVIYGRGKNEAQAIASKRVCIAGRTWASGSHKALPWPRNGLSKWRR